MPTHRNRTQTQTLPWLKATELAWAVPHVIAHRVARMAYAGASPSARDRKEFLLMGTEKVAAFADSWNAMATEAFSVYQQASIAWWRAAWTPWLPGAARPVSLRQAQASIMAKGLAPIHRRAVANARRLGRR